MNKSLDYGAKVWRLWSPDWRNRLGVEGAFDRQPAAIKDVSVDHGGLDVFVPEELLDGANIVSALQEVRGK